MREDGKVELIKILERKKCAVCKCTDRFITFWLHLKNKKVVKELKNACFSTKQFVISQSWREYVIFKLNISFKSIEFITVLPQLTDREKYTRKFVVDN